MYVAVAIDIRSRRDLGLPQRELHRSALEKRHGGGERIGPRDFGIERGRGTGVIVSDGEHTHTK